jgi:hypothetical protein
MKPDVRYFTAAHELGHVLLHPALKEAHRDRPLDGAAVAKEPREREADRFAAIYLMPSRLLTTRFVDIYKMTPFELSESTAFALWGNSAGLRRSKVSSKRDLSLILATAERFNGRQVVSLSQQFKVSPTAIAIRIEELGLVLFESN